MITLPQAQPVTSVPVADDQAVIDAFHQLYFKHFRSTWMDTWWMGTRVFKNPMDLIIYQEIITELKPDLIIETGTCLGGSALYLSHICDLIGHGHVVTVDVDPPDGKPLHQRLTYLQGSSVSPELVQKVRSLIKPGHKVLVILDSDHKQPHVARELAIYSDLVTPESYLIVEDTNINGHPVDQKYGPGPYEAVEDFLKTDKRYIVDSKKEKFLFTFNPRGYLKRIA
jgi:cephalosporin hydroxylase